MQRLRIVIPDLFWPDPRDDAPYEGWSLPALSTLMSRGKLTERGAMALETWLEEEFGGGDPASDFPWAAVERAGLGMAADEHHFCCADPVNLKAKRTALYLACGESLALTIDEAKALVNTLNSHFAVEHIEFSVIAPTRWHVRLDRPVTIQSTPVAQAQGRNIDALMPRGNDARTWIKRMNEAQMLLHEHPVNVARESYGAPPINSIWPWGFGSRPQLNRPPIDLLISPAPLYSGLGAVCNIAVASTSGGFAATIERSTVASALVILDHPRHALACSDGDAWRSALTAIDDEWLAPSLDALRSGRCETLEVIGLSQDNSVHIEVTRGDTWRFWRATRPWTQWRPKVIE